MIVLTGIVFGNAAHEMFHQYDFSKIEEVCFLGYEREDGIMNSGVAWILAKDYWHYEEKIPVRAGIVTVIITTIILGLIFRKDLRWW